MPIFLLLGQVPSVEKLVEERIRLLIEKRHLEHKLNELNALRSLFPARSSKQNG